MTPAARPTASSLPLILTACWVACLGLLTGCAQESGPERWVRVASLIEEAPEDWSPMPTFQERDIAFEWEFKTEADIDPWLLNQAQAEAVNDSWVLDPTGPDPSLARHLEPFDAERVHFVELAVAHTEPSSMQMYWSDGGPFNSRQKWARHFTLSPKRQEVQSKTPRSELVGQFFTFNARDHEHWQGEIGAFRLDPSNGKPITSRMLGIRGYRLRHHAEALTEHLDRPAMQDFQGDVRLAVPAPPGHQIRRHIRRLPKNARLRGAFGLQAQRGESFTFIVEAQIGDRRIELLSATVDPESEGGRWHPLDLDLSDHAGNNLELVWTTQGPTGPGLDEGIPVWAACEILAPSRKKRPPNVVLVIADTLRADRTSLHGHSRPTTPNLEAWAAEHAVTFDHAVAAAPWTLPSHVSMFTAVNPLRHGSNHRGGAAEGMTLLAERLQAQGYHTLAFTGGGFLTPAMGLAQGFERFKYSRYGTDPDLDAHLPQLLQWLDDRPPEPYFLLLHTFETHAPYKARQPWLDQFTAGQAASDEPPALITSPTKSLEEDGYRYHSKLRVRTGKPEGPRDAEAEDVEWLGLLYDSSVAHLDQGVGEILKRLYSDPERESLVIFTSDHGEALGENGVFGHTNMEEYNLRIPLAIALPASSTRNTGNKSRGRRVDDVVRHIDLAPTVLDALGLPPLLDVDGQSLLSFWSDQPDPHGPRMAESYAGSNNQGVSLRQTPWKLTYQDSPWAPHGGRRQLSRLGKGYDEQPTTESEPVDRLLPQLQRRLQAQCHLELRAQSFEDSPWVLGIKGDMANVHSLKAIEDGPEKLIWTEQRLHLQLDSGDRRHFYLAPQFRATTHLKIYRPVTGALPSEIPSDWDAEISPEVFGQVDKVGVVLKNGEWQATDQPLKPQDTGFTLAVRDSTCPWMRDSAAAGDELDDETRKQLQALGYVVQ